MGQWFDDSDRMIRRLQWQFYLYPIFRLMPIVVKRRFLSRILG